MSDLNGTYALLAQTPIVGQNTLSRANIDGESGDTLSRHFPPFFGAKHDQ